MEDRIKLYSMLVDQLDKYNAIFWQALALVVANVLALDKLISFPWGLMGLAIFDLAMIWAFHRMVVAQGKIITATRAAEEDLRKNYPHFVATFPLPNAPTPSLRTGSARSWLVLTMFLLAVWLGAFAVQLGTRRVSARQGATLAANKQVWVLDEKTREPKLVGDPLGIRTDTLVSVEVWRDPRTDTEWHRNQETGKLEFVQRSVGNAKTDNPVGKR